METRTTAAGDGGETRTVEVVFPTDTNSMGTLFGGRALSLMDRLAFIVASRFARKPVVTVCSEKVEFRTAVKEGNLIELVGRIGHVGRTSLTVEIDMYAEDLLSGDRNLCTTGQFVLVAVGADGRPTPISSGDTADVERPGSHSGSLGSRRGGDR
jgi:acyl-CoA hydrolase